jgi:hypothetical protein
MGGPYALTSHTGLMDTTEKLHPTYCERSPVLACRQWFLCKRCLSLLPSTAAPASVIANESCVSPAGNHGIADRARTRDPRSTIHRPLSLDIAVRCRTGLAKPICLLLVDSHFAACCVLGGVRGGVSTTIPRRPVGGILWPREYGCKARKEAKAGLGGCACHWGVGRVNYHSTLFVAY